MHKTDSKSYTAKLQNGGEGYGSKSGGGVALAPLAPTLSRHCAYRPDIAWGEGGGAHRYSIHAKLVGCVENPHAASGI